MVNQKLKLWVLIIIFAFTASLAAIPSAQARSGSNDFDFRDDIGQVFTIFFKDIRKAYDNLFTSFEKMFEEMLADFERSLEEALEEITGDIKKDNGDGDDNGGGARDGQKPQDQPGGDNAKNNNDGKDGDINQNNGDQGANDQNGQQQGNKDDDFPNLGNDNVKDDNGSNGNISSGQNIGSNPWDILNKRAQKPQDDKTSQNAQKPQNQGGDNNNVNPPKPPQNNNDNVVRQPQPPIPQPPVPPQPPAPKPPAPQPPVPPLPPNNNNQNVNNNFKDPFDEMIKQQNRQINGDNTDKNNTVDNRPADAKELIKKIQEKFGVTIVDGEPPKYVWTPQELKTTFDILSELPSSFVKKTSTLAKGSAEAVFPGMSNIGGFASGSSITITPLGLNCDYRRVLIHEMGHCFHFQTYELQNQFQQKFWSGRNGYSGSAGGANPPAISQYGGSNVMEDMAEAIAYYVVYGKSMKQMSPERYELVKNLVMEGKEW